MNSSSDSKRRQHKKIKRRKRTKLLLFLMLSSLWGCANAGPRYVKPAVHAPDAWSAKTEGGITNSESNQKDLAEWWNVLDNPELTRLIEAGISGNLDIKTAQARLLEARAQRGLASAERFPSLTSSAKGSVSRTTGENVRSDTQDMYDAGFDASWEIDVFGGKKRSLEAAESSLRAEEENIRDVLISVISEIALNYIEACSYQTRLEIAKENLAAQEDLFKIVCWRYEAGLTTHLDVDQAKYGMEQTRAQLPSLRTNIWKSKNRIAVLLGKNPGSFADSLELKPSIPVTPIEVAVGVPADVLRRRPDVRYAERILASRTAQVGVATAEKYPSFTLRGSTGLESLSIKDLFSTGTLVSSLAANVVWPVFDAGRIRQNIKIATAVQEQALVSYESAVLNALEEVENALVAYAEEQNHRMALQEASKAAQNALELVKYQYTSGWVDFQNVLNSQQASLSLQDQLASSESAVTSNLIRLYKALGGGWSNMKPEMNN